MSMIEPLFRPLSTDSFQFAFSDGSPVLTLQDILENPRFSAAPTPVVSHLAWMGRTTLLSAREKDGKSTLAGAAAAAVSAGADFLGDQTVRGAVIWIGLEEHTSDSARRLAQFGADASQVIPLHYLPSDPDDLDRLIAEVRPALVVIDTLSAYASGAVRDAASSAQWVPVMQSLTAIARNFDSAVLILHHSRKGGDGGYRDSSAIGAAVDTLIEMQQGRGENQRVLVTKGRLGPPEQMTIELQGTTYVRLSNDLDVAKKTLEFLSAHPGSGRRDIRRAVGGRGTAVDDTIECLIKDGEIVNRGSPSKHAYYLASHAALVADQDDAEGPNLPSLQGHEQVVGSPKNQSSEPDRVRPRLLEAGAGHASARRNLLPRATR